MKTEPDLDSPDGVKQLLYISQERVVEITRAAAGGPEFFIQIQLGDFGNIFGLTNYGRLFQIRPGDDAWEKVDVPDFDETPEP